MVGLEFSWPHLLHVSLQLRLRQSCAGNRIALLGRWVRAAADRQARILQLHAGLYFQVPDSLAGFRNLRNAKGRMGKIKLFPTLTPLFLFRGRTAS